MQEYQTDVNNQDHQQCSNTAWLECKYRAKNDFWYFPFHIRADYSVNNKWKSEVDSIVHDIHTRTSNDIPNVLKAMHDSIDLLLELLGADAPRHEVGSDEDVDELLILC